jgi:hypothetical protein
MVNSWMQALKIWNQGKEMWCVCQKKGTDDYNEVLAIMENNPPTLTKKKSKNKIEKKPNWE